jgi:hypothetical protein
MKSTIGKQVHRQEKLQRNTFRLLLPIINDSTLLKDNKDLTRELQWKLHTK